MANVVSLIVRLVDQFSNQAPKVVSAIKNIDGAMTKAAGSGSRFSNIATRIAGVAAGASGLAAVAAGVGRKLDSTMRKSAEFEHGLVGISRTGNMTAEQLNSLRSTVLKLSPLMGIMAEDLAKAAGDLVNAGIDPANAERMLSPMARVAKATQAKIEDVQKAAVGLFQNLDIPADQLESTFDKLWVATKRGNFELKDMAKHFRQIATRAQGVGMSGQNAAVELAAAAQVVRQGAGDPSQAATNLDNLLAKLMAPQTVKKFKDFGIDLNKEIAEGAAKGQSPLETVILQAKKVLAENKDVNVGHIFPDMQAQAALAKLVEKYEEFVSIRNEAMQASGTIADDFKAMHKTLFSMLEKLDAEIDARQKKWNQVAEPWSRWRTETLQEINRWLGDLTERFPRLSKALGGFSLAAADGFSVLGSLGQPLLALASAFAIGKFLGIGKGIASVARTIWKLLFPIRFLMSVLGGAFAELAVILGPLLLRGLMALGPLAMKGIAALVALLSGPAGWALLGAALATGLAYYFREPLLKALNATWDVIRESWSQLTETLGSIDITGTLSNLATNIAAKLGEAASAAMEAGRNIMTKLLDGLKAAAQSVINWAGSFVGRLKSLFSFSVSPTITPQGGGAATVQPQSHRGGGLTPAPAMRQASASFTNTFNINGADNPESVAQRIVAALDRQRQAGLYDGALA